MNTTTDKYRPTGIVFLIGIIDFAIGAALLFPPVRKIDVVGAVAIVSLGAYPVYCGITRGCR